jgi:hypothetical protein
MLARDMSTCLADFVAEVGDEIGVGTACDPFWLLAPA